MVVPGHVAGTRIITARGTLPVPVHAPAIVAPTIRTVIPAIMSAAGLEGAHIVIRSILTGGVILVAAAAVLQAPLVPVAAVRARATTTRFLTTTAKDIPARYREATTAASIMATFVTVR